MKTYATKAKDIKRKWYLVNAKNKVLGRLASKIAKILMGKHKEYWCPYIDCGDHVIVINAKDVILTGEKLKQRFEFRHSGYLGNPKFIPYEKLLEKNPERLIYLAVKGMLPKNKMRKKYLSKLKIYKNSYHPHVAQQPEVLNL